MVAIASYRYKNASDGVVTDLETIDGLRYTRNNNQSITEGVSTTIDFDTVQQNVSGSADPLSSGVLTIPTAGVWRFDFAAGGQDGVFFVIDEKAQNSSGGNAPVDNPILRDLNTVKENTIDGASLANNTITLPQGRYFVTCMSTAYDMGRAQISIRDTGNNIIVQGISDFGSTTYNGYVVCELEGYFTLNSITNLQLILNRENNVTNDEELGIGNNGAWGVEIFSSVHITRVPGNLTLYKTPVATISPLTYDSPILMGTYDASGGHQLVTCAKYDKIELKYNGYLIANSSDKKVFLSIEYRAGATTARAVGLIADDVTGVIETAGSLTVGNALTVTGKVGIGTNNPDSKVDIIGSVITGITWNANTFTTRTSAADNNWRDVVWAPELGLFVAVANIGSGDRVMTSTDGITWTTRSTNDNGWHGITWAPELGLLVAVAASGTGNRVMTSPDGINWTTRTSAADNDWMNITWAPELGLLVAVAQSGTGNRVMTSPDGINWTTRVSPADYAWFNITWAPELGLLVAVSISVTVNNVMTSPDGINWTTRSTNTNYWIGITWAPELGLLVAVAWSGTGDRVMTSPDGINWTTRTSAADNEWMKVSWVPELGLLIAVGRTGTNNRIMTSPDGVTWTTRANTVDNQWWGIAWAPELGILVSTSETGTGNRVMTASANTATSSILKVKEMKNSIEISNITVPYDTNNNRKLTIRGDTTISGNGIFPGKVGIGTTNPYTVLHIKQLNSHGGGSINTDTTKANILLQSNNLSYWWGLACHGTSDWGNLGFHMNGTEKCFMLGNGTNQALNFTGQHRCFVYNKSYEELQSFQGLIVSSNKNKYIKMSNGIATGKEAITLDESLPIVDITCIDNCKAVFGVISLTEDPDKRQDEYGAFVTPFHKEKGDTRVYINSVGEGGIWISNINGILESGDYITSSTIPGYGKKQTDDILHNYTVAKITMNCDFSPLLQNKQQIKKDINGNNILDNKGNIIWEDKLDENGTVITEEQYDIRYLIPNGTIITKDEYELKLNNNEEVYKAAFVGCTYHCG